MVTDDGSVWYIAYGSNLLFSRLQAYLPERHEVPRSFCSATPHRIYFAGHASRWGGAPAFLDTARSTSDDAALIRGYLLGASELHAIAAQENGLPIHALSDFRIPARPNSASTIDVPGKYNILQRLDDVESLACVALTTDRPLEFAIPSPSYLATMRAGLIECNCFEAEEIDRYMTRIVRYSA